MYSGVKPDGFCIGLHSVVAGMSQLDDYPECLADFKTYHERTIDALIADLEAIMLRPVAMHRTMLGSAINKHKRGE